MQAVFLKNTRPAFSTKYLEQCCAASDIREEEAASTHGATACPLKVATYLANKDNLTLTPVPPEPTLYHK
jgi:hypothetical protein